MKAVIQWLGSILVACSIGTMVTLVVLVGMLWWKGALADERMLGMLAALQGIKPATPEEKAKSLDPKSEQPSIDEIMQARLRTSLDLDLRESAIDKSLGDLRTLETQIRTESVRLDNWKKSFDQRVTDLQTAATDAALLELQRTLEAMAPAQAKDQIMKMLEKPVSSADKPMNDVVAIMKAMPLDKRRKILGAFKAPQEIEKLHAVLDEIRRGTPETELLDDTRKQLQQQQNAEP